MQTYPQNVTQDNILDTVQQICRIRSGDINDRNNLPNIFISGRKVNRVPSSSADVTTNDKTGDFNYDLNYIYILIGTVWRRASLGSW